MRWRWTSSGLLAWKPLPSLPAAQRTQPRPLALDRLPLLPHLHAESEKHNLIDFQVLAQLLRQANNWPRRGFIVSMATNFYLMKERLSILFYPHPRDLNPLPFPYRQRPIAQASLGHKGGELVIDPDHKSERSRRDDRGL